MVSTDLISLVAVFLSIIAIAISWLVYTDNHKHKRLFDTVEIIKGWDSESILNARAKVTQLRDSHQMIVPEAIPLKLILKQREKDFEARKSITISDHINTLLNYMNIIAIGIQAGIYNEELCKQTLEQPFKRLYFALEEYRDELVSPRVRFKNPWPELTELIEKWDDSASTKDLRAPGKLS